MYVHPDYQRQGIGSQLLHEMYAVLNRHGIEEFCLDSGFTIAQRVWKKKFGDPDYFLENYWGDGEHHMIWRIKVNEVIK